MYVCICKSITDSQIRDAVHDGASSYRDVRDSLGVGTQCGKCACWAKDLVSETVTEISTCQASRSYAIA